MRDFKHDLAHFGEFGSVAQEVDQNLAQPQWVAQQLIRTSGGTCAANSSPLPWAESPKVEIV
jgi:hypothetical protein